jgi:hypothetical protein
LNKATLKALKGSIRKWERIVAGDGGDDGAANCPLCREFRFGVEFGRVVDCVGCPVMAESGLPYCSGTPYTGWMQYHDGLARAFPLNASTPEEISLAQAELDFLRGLLPRKKKPRTIKPKSKRSKVKHAKASPRKRYRRCGFVGEQLRHLSEPAERLGDRVHRRRVAAADRGRRQRL